MRRQESLSKPTNQQINKNMKLILDDPEEDAFAWAIKNCYGCTLTTQEIEQVYKYFQDFQEWITSEERGALLVSAEEILERFQSFKSWDDFISLVGGVAGVKLVESELPNEAWLLGEIREDGGFLVCMEELLNCYDDPQGICRELYHKHNNSKE